MSKWAIQFTWDDTPHLSDAAKSDLLASIPEYQREARTKGIPQLGSGVIYPIPEAEVVCEPFEIPAHFAQAYGMDVGWKMTTAIWAAHDRDADVVYLYAEHFRSHTEPVVHAEAIRARGTWIPGVIDPASRGRAQHDGQQLMAAYRELGLDLSAADNAVESGIYQVWHRLTTGRLKIFKTMVGLLGEYRIYRRDERGKIVKENDHGMDAMRYLIVSGLARAIIRPADLWPQRRPKGHQIDYDPFGEAWKRDGGGGQQTGSGSGLAR